MESRRPTIDKMVPWTRVVAVEMLRIVGVCIDLKGRTNGFSDGFGFGGLRTSEVKNDSMTYGLQLEEWSCHFLRWGRLKVKQIWRNDQRSSFDRSNLRCL